MPPLVSVITICRNSREFIEQCIESVLLQDFEDFEYVVIDGGSTDGTVDVIQKYESALAYWHSRPDRGLAHAFNQGVGLSQGRWLIFLNSDDYFADTTALSRMANRLAHHESADVVFGQVLLVTRDQRAEPILLAGRSWKWSQFRRQDTISHQAAFTNRRFFNKFGNFDESFRIVVDYEHYLRAGKELSAIFVPELVSKMRTGGLSRALKRQSLNEMRLAQRKHGVWPAPWIADALYGFYLMRGAVGDRIRHWSGRQG